jgi:S-adenosylmethionine:tRNA ribosyltransferase-isomerase
MSPDLLVRLRPVRLQDFDYDLPPARIAQTPIEPRDAARLLADRGPLQAPDHLHVRDLPQLLHEGDVVVVNDSRVIPARLLLRRASGGAAEVLLLEPLEPTRRAWEAMVKPARKLRRGEPLFGDDGDVVVEIGSRTEAGDTFTVSIAGDGDPLAVLDRVGRMPLPPYITTPLADAERYQTVYSRSPGSAAAPTAGLHLTNGVLTALANKGIPVERVELVVGLDTFQPVTEDDPTVHRIHTERYRVPDETLAACDGARRVVAVGTTAVRALETARTTGVTEGRSSLFIHRPYDWKLVDVLLTNFHLPRTTLLMLIDAFVGPRWRDLYATALAGDYRFLSFGDAMLLTREWPS